MADVIIFSEQDIRDRVAVLAELVSAHFRDQEIVLVGLLNGCAMFTTDLAREIERVRLKGSGVKACYMDFMRVSSYGDAKETTGRVQVQMDMQKSPEGKHVILVDDVAETCLTLEFVLAHIRAKKPLSVRVCVLVSKPDRHKCTDVSLDYIGFAQEQLPFLKGYGMDEEGRDRALPYIAACE